MKPNVSQRGRVMPASPIRKLMPLADQARQRGVHVYHLNIGQPDLETPEPIRKRLRTFTDPVLAYTPSGGTPEYLKTVQTYYERLGILLGLDQLIATTGGSEALLFSMLACANEGDEGIVVEPFYTNYRSFAAMTGVKLVAIRSRGEDGFHLPPRAEWDAAVTPKTKFIILCNPNNPTGTVYSDDELRMVATICRDRGLFLIVDEVYREFVYDGRGVSSALSLRDCEDMVIVVDSLSKRYSACGIRLGSLATRNREVYDACLRMAQGRLSAPGIAQAIAVGATELGADYHQGVVAEYERRRDVLFEGLTSIPGVFLRKPEGAFYFIARLPVADSEDFASWLLTDFDYKGATVMVAPAKGFYLSAELGKDEVRIAYVLKESDLVASVEVLRAALDEYCRIRGLTRPTQRPSAPDSPDFQLPAES